MKKIVCAIVCCVLAISSLLAGCGNSTKKIFAKDWELVEFTVKGTTTKAADLDAETKKLAPTFRSEDGKSCVFSNNGKDHAGTIKEDNGQYVISFGDTSVTMTAVVNGDRLTLTNSKGTLTLIFQASK